MGRPLSKGLWIGESSISGFKTMCYVGIVATEWDGWGFRRMDTGARKGMPVPTELGKAMILKRGYCKRAENVKLRAGKIKNQDTLSVEERLLRL